VLPIQFGIVIPGWVAIAIVSRRLRGRCRTDHPLVHAVCQLYFGWFGYVSYAFGSNTSLYPAVILLGGAAFVLALFARLPMLLGLGTFTAIVLGSVVAAQAGVLRYAPLLRTAPFENGRLDQLWLLGLGGVEFVALAAATALIVFVIDRWHDREARLARATEVIGRYVAPQLRQAATDLDQPFGRRERRPLTLVFADIAGSCALADRIAADAFCTMLDEYMVEMIAIADQYGGTIDKFMGDALLVIFGAPVSTGTVDEAARAVAMSLAMQRRTAALAARWRATLGADDFQIRVGINSGFATIGNFGASGRLTYTAIGQQVNLAARLQSACTPGNVLISETTWRLVKDHVPCTPRGALVIRGFAAPVHAYEVAASHPGAGWSSAETSGS
jgi:class 3 adenylate cyclase